MILLGYEYEEVYEKDCHEVSQEVCHEVYEKECQAVTSVGTPTVNVKR
jgi:hypothetical protein